MRSLKSLEYSMTVKLLTEHPSEFLSLTEGYTGSSESTLVEMPHFLEISSRGSTIVIGNATQHDKDCLY